MREKHSGARISDQAQRLIDTVCQALRATNQVQVGDYLVGALAGTGKLLARQGQSFELRPHGEMLLRELLMFCTTPGLTDEERERRCFAAMRRLEGTRA